MTAKEKLKVYIIWMKHEGLLGYANSIEKLLEHLDDDGVDLNEYQ